jgi:cell fate regulator YaaT (PSP1 superfamily)
LATYGKPRFLGILDIDDETAGSIKDGFVIVTSHRGEEFAEVVGALDERQEREYRSMRSVSEHGEGPPHGGDPVVTDLTFSRLPADTDFDIQSDHRRQEDENLHIAHELAAYHKLALKLIDDELTLDGRKLFFYFTSDQRVDFRQLVKDLARKFHTRIELRQMGVRDEARIIKGLSSCGLPCCCSYWLNQFTPIGIKMVKEQNIALNPPKISGICGRLMCCMAFEHKVYREAWAGMPGPGSKIKTPRGNYIVQSIDIAKDALRCHCPTGGDVCVPKAMFEEFKQAVSDGNEWTPPQADEPETARFTHTEQADTSVSNQQAQKTERPGGERHEQGGGEGSQRRPGRRRHKRGGAKPNQPQAAQPQNTGSRSDDRPREAPAQRGRADGRPKQQQPEQRPSVKNAAPQSADGPQAPPQGANPPQGVKSGRRRRKRPNSPNKPQGEAKA